MYSDEQAIDKLTDVFDRFPRLVPGDNDSRQLAKDLVEWFNSTELSRDDLADLIRLVKNGSFDAWECPTCDDGTRVFMGTPDDWSNFQGVCNADYASFPGYGIGIDDKRCDHCRMFMKGEATYIPDGYAITRIDKERD